MYTQRFKYKIFHEHFPIYTKKMLYLHFANFINVLCIIII